jgi:ankyrin repeat protein
MKVYLEEVEAHPRTRNYYYDQGIAPLHVAAYSGSVSLYEEILKKSQIQNPESNYGKTPLYIAAGKGHFLLCKAFMIRH